MTGKPGKSGGSRPGAGRPAKMLEIGETVVISIQGPGVQFRLVEMTVESADSRRITLAGTDGWKVAISR